MSKQRPLKLVGCLLPSPSPADPLWLVGNLCSGNKICSLPSHMAVTKTSFGSFSSPMLRCWDARSAVPATALDTASSLGGNIFWVFTPPIAGLGQVLMVRYNRQPPNQLAHSQSFNLSLRCIALPAQWGLLNYEATWQTCQTYRHIDRLRDAERDRRTSYRLRQEIQLLKALQKTLSFRQKHIIDSHFVCCLDQRECLQCDIIYHRGT